MRSDEFISENLKQWFKEKWVRFGPDGKIRGDCARGSEGEGKPKCLPQAKAQALGKKGRASAAAKKRREDPNPERRGAAKNVATKVKEDDLDEACWKGYHKEGNKELFGKRVPNCVKNEAVAEGEGSYPEVLYHGSTQEIKGPLTPRQAHDIGGAPGSNKNAIYATDDPNFAIAYSLAERGSDTGTLGWKQDPHLIFFGGKIRHGQNVYLYTLPTRDQQGNPLFTPGSADAEWHSVPGVTAVTPIKVKALPVDRYLGLLRKPTPDEQKVFQANQARDKAKRGMAEGHESCPECGGAMYPDTMINEKQDACYYKVKSRYKVWPSAYASGALVQCRKKGAKNWGNKNESQENMMDELDRILELSTGLSLEARAELAEEFDLIESNINMLAERNGVDAEVIWEDLESLSDDELYVFAVTQPIMEDLDEMDRRGFLKSMGAGAALAGASSLGANTAFAQSMPNINTQKLNLANKYYAALVQRAKEDGLPLDTRTKNMLKAKAEEMATRQLQQTQSSYPGAQSSEIKRSNNYNQFESEAWQKANNRDKTDGMSKKAVKSYRREHPGSKLQTAVTTKPSKLKKGSKASKRRKSYCSRSRGQMKMHNISCAKTPDKAICKARRRWNC